MAHYWPTDRVRVCIKELYRMQKLPYTLVSRNEGLALLAGAASLSIEEVQDMNPILYIRKFLNDTPDDPIELLMKMCQMFGPYTYRELAILYANPRLTTIQEISEPPSPSSPSVQEFSIPDISDTSDNTFTDVDLSEATFVDLSEGFTVVDLSEPTDVDLSSNTTTVVEPISFPIVVSIAVPVPISDAAPLLVSCGCFSWFQKRPK